MKLNTSVGALVRREDSPLSVEAPWTEESTPKGLQWRWDEAKFKGYQMQRERARPHSNASPVKTCNVCSLLGMTRQGQRVSHTADFDK